MTWYVSSETLNPTDSLCTAATKNSITSLIYFMSIEISSREDSG